MSETVPSVKGSIFMSVVNDLKLALEEGRLSPEDLEAHLDEKDRALLEDVVTSVSWVPAASYGRMLDLLALVEGGSDREAYLRRRGANAAERLLSGTYECFDAGPGTWGRRAGELMIGLASVVYNFTRWHVSELSPETWEIVSEGAEAFPDAATHTTLGFLQWYVDRTSNGRVCASVKRPSRDRLVFEVSPKG